jgi:hypothetical protein
MVNLTTAPATVYVPVHTRRVSSQRAVHRPSSSSISSPAIPSGTFAVRRLLRAAPRGSGLRGLFRCIEAHGGRLAVDSPPGRGACVMDELRIGTSERA